MHTCKKEQKSNAFLVLSGSVIRRSYGLFPSCVITKSLLLSSFLADEGPDSTSSYYPVQAECEMEDSKFILPVYSCWSVSKSLANDLSSSPSFKEKKRGKKKKRMKKGTKIISNKSRENSGSFLSSAYLFPKVKSCSRGVTFPPAWIERNYII